MDMPVTADVNCADGPCGQSTSLIIDPTDQHVTHVVVRQKGPGGVEHMVPLALVRDATRLSIMLKCTADSLAKLERFLEDDYAWVYLPLLNPSPGYYLGWPNSTDPASTPTGKRHDHVPLGELAIQREVWVEATDGRLGRLEGFQVSPEDQRILSLVVREWVVGEQKILVIPVSTVDLIQENIVYLNTDLDSLRGLSSRPSQPLKPSAE